MDISWGVRAAFSNESSLANQTPISSVHFYSRLVFLFFINYQK